MTRSYEMDNTSPHHGLHVSGVVGYALVGSRNRQDASSARGMMLAFQLFRFDATSLGYLFDVPKGCKRGRLYLYLLVFVDALL